MANVEHLVFDLSEVFMNGIMDLPEAIEGAIYGRVPLFQSPDSDLNVYSDFFKLKEDFLRKLFVGEISETEFFNNLLKMRNYPLSVKELKDITRQNFWQFDHTGNLLSGLRSEGYDLILFSDHAKEWVKYIESNFSFLQMFNKRIYSFDSLHTKREPESFEYLIKEASLDRNKTVFIDDMPGNIEVAKEIGIRHTQCYRDPKRLVSYLTQLGVKCAA